MKLTPHEINTPLWVKLVEFYTPKLSALRTRIENPTTPDAERTALAWRIKEIKEFLALGQPEHGKGDGA